MLNNKKIQCVGINTAGIVIVRDESITLNKFAPDVVSILDSKATKTELQTGLGAKADKEYNSGFIGGKNAKLNAVGGVAAGLNAQASSGSATGSGAQASEGMAAGSGAYTSHGGAGGKDAYSMHGGSLGRGAKTLHGAAVGDGAQTVDADGNPITGIQLGTGTNTEEGTAKFFDYTMMNADGTIPNERVPYTVKRYDVAELPLDSVDNNGLYVTPDGQYIYRDGVPIKVGTDDLSEYYTKEEIDYTVSSLHDQMSNYYTKTETDAKLKENYEPFLRRIGVWDEGYDFMPIWRVVFMGTITYNADDPTSYIDKNYTPFKNYETGEYRYVKSLDNITFVNGHMDFSFDESFDFTYVGLRLNDFSFDSPSIMNNSTPFQNHNPIYYKGYIEFATPESNIAS